MEHEDTPVPNDLSARVVVHEGIAAVSQQVLVEIRSELRELRRELREMRDARRSNFRWLLGVLLGGFGMTASAFTGLLGAAAHGFGWI